MYGVVQFAATEGGTVSVVVSKWLTPNKTGVFWPPTKEAKVFDKLLQRCSSPSENWTRYEIDRMFYETDYLDKAKKKLSLVEVTSDIQTEEEETNKSSKRKIKKNSRYIPSDEDTDNEGGPTRPPPLKKPLLSYIQYQAPSKTTELITDSQIPDICAIESDGNQTNQLQNFVNTPLGSQDKVVSLLAHIKAQNNLILQILQDRTINKAASLKAEFKLPVKTFEELQTVEQLLSIKENHGNLVAYFRSLGGQGVNNKVSRIMKTTLTESMASKFNFYGKRSDKKPFTELHLRVAIVESLKTSETTEKEIEDSIKVWLKHAPEREKKSLSKAKQTDA